MNSKPFFFEVESFRGNKYIYDVASNLIFPNRKIFLDVLELYPSQKISEILNLLSLRYPISDLDREYAYVSKQVNELGCFFADFKKVIKPRRYSLEEIKRKVANVSQLILEVTQECNFSCKYCVFSGAYRYKRGNNPTTMDFDIARAAIDIYFDLLNSELRSNTRNDAYIAFYGGEPFLNIGLIKRTIEYANKKRTKTKTEIKYLITTNGSLLNNQDCITLLAKNIVRLDISLDGPKSVQDQGRVFRDGRGTFDIVFGNVKAINKMFPDYYKECVRFLVTLFKEYNPFEIEEFFEDSRYFKRETVMVLNMAEEDRIIKELTVDQIINRRFMEQINKMQLRYFELIKNGREKELSNFSYSYFWKNLADRFSRKNYVCLRDKNRYTKTCFPLNFRLFVSADGNFHVCEKINHNFPLGDSEHGINYILIKELWDAYVNAIEQKRCWSCDVQNFCHQCLAMSAKDKEFRFDDCDKNRELHKAYIVNCISSLEEKPLSGVNDEKSDLPCRSDPN